MDPIVSPFELREDIPFYLKLVFDKVHRILGYDRYIKGSSLCSL